MSSKDCVLCVCVVCVCCVCVCVCVCMCVRAVCVCHLLPAGCSDTELFKELVNRDPVTREQLIISNHWLLATVPHLLEAWSDFCVRLSFDIILDFSSSD